MKHGLFVCKLPLIDIEFGMPTKWLAKFGSRADDPSQRGSMRAVFNGRDMSNVVVHPVIRETAKKVYGDHVVAIHGDPWELLIAPTDDGDDARCFWCGQATVAGTASGIRIRLVDGREILAGHLCKFCGVVLAMSQEDSARVLTADADGTGVGESQPGGSNDRF